MYKTISLSEAITAPFKRYECNNILVYVTTIVLIIFSILGIFFNFKNNLIIVAICLLLCALAYLFLIIFFYGIQFTVIRNEIEDKKHFVPSISEIGKILVSGLKFFGAMFIQSLIMTIPISVLNLLFSPFFSNNTKDLSVQIFGICTYFIVYLLIISAYYYYVWPCFLNFIKYDSFDYLFNFKEGLKLIKGGKYLKYLFGLFVLTILFYSIFVIFGVLAALFIPAMGHNAISINNTNFIVVLTVAGIISLLLIFIFMLQTANLHAQMIGEAGKIEDEYEDEDYEYDEDSDDELF